MKKKLPLPKPGRLALLLGLLCADRLSKWAVLTHLKGRPPLVLVPGVLEFVYTENTGAAFSMLLGNNRLLLLLNLALAAAIVWAGARLPAAAKWNRLKATAAVLLAGALGNIIDRAVYGFVVDFVYFVPINFPKFNLADSCIVLAAIALFGLLCFTYRDSDLKELRFFGKTAAAPSDAQPPKDGP